MIGGNKGNICTGRRKQRVKRGNEKRYRGRGNMGDKEEGEVTIRDRKMEGDKKARTKGVGTTKVEREREGQKTERRKRGEGREKERET